MEPPLREGDSLSADLHFSLHNSKSNPLVSSPHCIRIPSVVSPSSLTLIAILLQFFFPTHPSLQNQQAFSGNIAISQAKKTGRLTADHHLSFLSSKSKHSFIPSALFLTIGAVSPPFMPPSPKEHKYILLQLFFPQLIALSQSPAPTGIP